MTLPVINKLKQYIKDADGLYCRLVLLVGRPGSGKTGILKEAADELGTSVINLNLVLSAELLELTARQRCLKLPGIIKDIANEAKTPVMFDNTEILFNTELKNDPLRLLQAVSRERVTAASWSGSYINGRLIYAEPGHPEYRCYDSVDALVVSIEQINIE